MQMYKSLSPKSPLHIESAFASDVVVVVASQALSLFNSSSVLSVLGCDLTGKLIDRTLYRFEGFGENEAIVALFIIERLRT